MYIRRTTIKSRKDGGQYYTYRLVESRRTVKGVRQHTLLNLGVDFSLAREQWRDLTKRIEEILSGQQSLFEIGSNVDKLAQGYASKIVLSHQDIDDSVDIDYREVNIDSIEMSRQRSVGCEHVTLEALRLLGLDEKLGELGVNGPQTAAAIGTISGLRPCFINFTRDLLLQNLPASFPKKADRRRNIGRRTTPLIESLNYFVCLSQRDLIPSLQI